jgi:glycosyltransferase involved in cell wall biosynthesis
LSPPGDRSVAILLPFPTFGAVEDYGLILSEGLARREWKVLLIHHRGLPLPDGLVSSIAEQGEVVPVGQDGLRRIGRLRSLLRGLRPNVVHVNHTFLPGIVAATSLGRSRVVVTEHTPALSVRYSIKARLALAWGAPRVDRWVVLSERNRQLLAKKYGVKERRIWIIPPGLPVDRFPPAPPAEARRLLGLDEGSFVVGTVGRISRQKRHDLLIEACAQVATGKPETRLVILGDGELRKETERLAAERLPGRVLFAGHRSDVPALLPAFDVFCLSSDYEGLPFAILEAMAMGRAIVTTDVQGAGEAVRNEQEGLLVPAGEPGPLATAILRLGRDRAFAERLGERARERFLSTFTADRMVARTVQLYEGLSGPAGS